MQFNPRRLAPFTLCLSLFAPALAGQQVSQTMKGWYEAKGSAPPYAVFPCIDNLSGRQYSKTGIQDCLKIISTKPYVKRARVRESKRGNPGEILVTFSVQTRDLVVTQLAFEMDTGEAELREWLSRNAATLLEGQPYSTAAEAVTWEGIRQFYRTRGILVIATPTVNLDYETGTARVKFAITRGPQIPVEGAFPPYGKSCDDIIWGVDESEIDTHVPREYVESKITLISGYVCYSSDAAQRDVEALKALQFLNSVTVTYSDDPPRHQVSYKLQGKPLHVRVAKVDGFGASAECLAAASQKLTIAGEIYRQSAVDHLVRELQEEVCKQPGNWVEVRVEERPVDDSQVDVTFNLVVSPRQAIIINGSKVD